jgi:hypothetical protein
LPIKENEMNKRIGAVIAVATLVTLSTGCCGMKNFCFGRGARCGLCTKLSNVRPQFGNVLQAPCGQTPYTQPQYAAPAYQDAAQGECECNQHAAPAYADSGACGTCYGSSYGNSADNYGPVVADPYLNGEVIHGGGQVYGSPVEGSPVYGNPGSTIDDFNSRVNSRKVDADGNKILWEEPLPPGAKAL